MKKTPLFYLSCCMITLGLFLNKWVVTAIVSPDGAIDSPSLNIRIVTFEGFLLLTGFVLLRNRAVSSVPLKTIVCAGIGLGLMACGILLNEWIIARLLHLYGSSVQIRIWIIDGVAILLGLLLIRYRNTFSFHFLQKGYMLMGMSICVSLLGTEAILRFAGYQPYIPPTYNIRVEPGGKFYQPHPTLGYTHIPGQFRVTTPPDDAVFTVTHLPNTLRITHPLQTYPSEPPKDEVWIFGCSFTHGWGLNDNQTFAWLLQEQLPQYEFVNFGADGYGTLHALIQCREALQRSKPPKIVLLMYASFHDERNTFLRTRRKILTALNRLGPQVQPYARFDQNGQLHYYMAQVTYREFPFMRYSALLNLLEETYNRLESRFTKPPEVTKAIVKDFLALAQAQGIKFVVAGLTADPLTAEMLAYCRQEGATTVDLAVDLTMPKYRLSPYDSHPNAVANIAYAQKLETCLRSELH